MNNNYKSEGFGMQRFEDDLSRVLVESAKGFAQLSGVFAQSYLLAQSTNVLPQSTNELTWSANKWA